MFQAEQAHTTTAPCAPTARATSPKALHYGLTRSQIMCRAWQLAKLNRTSFNVAPKASCHWQALAWKEASEGRTEYWSFLSAEHEARNIRDRLALAEMNNGSDHFSDHNLSLVQALRQSLAELEAGAGQ